MDVEHAGGTSEELPGPLRERAEPLERFARSLGAAGTRGWEPPTAPGITVERLLGIGGGALVWLVWWDSPDEPAWQLVDGCPPAAFALKVPRVPSAGRTSLDRAAAELAALDMLRHEHLVRAYGALETSCGLGLMLEPYSAGSLGGLLRSVGTLSLGEVVTVLTPIATALGALHQGGVTHGDVSPGNILLAADGKPALGDLADAAILGTPRSDCGTPGFAAPERELEGRLRPGADSATRREARAGLAPEADVYSLAAVAWFALTGSVPGQGRRRAPLQSLRPELPAPLTLLLEAALDGDSRRRPSAEDFAVELFRCAAPTALDLAPHVHEEVVPELPTPQGAATGRRDWAARLGAVALSALILAGLLFSAGFFIPSPTTAPVPARQLTEQPTGETGVKDQGLPRQEPAEREGELDAEVDAAQSGRAQGSEESGSGDRAPWQLLHHQDPVRAVEGLAALRTQALRDASEQQVQRYTAAQSPARTAEAALVRGFAEAERSYQGDPLEIRVSPNSRGADDQGAGIDRQGPAIAQLHARVTATALDSGVPESQEVVLVLHRKERRWLLNEVREVRTAAESDVAVGEDAPRR